MLSRALWTGLLALLAWVPIWRGQSALLRVERGERALFAVSALDVANDQPSRVGEGSSLPRLVSTRKPPTWRGLPTSAVDVELLGQPSDIRERRAAVPMPNDWRGFLPRRLVAPHDATAPPSLQS
jgi:hypothetical protein